MSLNTKEQYLQVYQMSKYILVYDSISIKCPNTMVYELNGINMNCNYHLRYNLIQFVLFDSRFILLICSVLKLLIFCTAKII